jgi:hypothetical protein
MSSALNRVAAVPLILMIAACGTGPQGASPSSISATTSLSPQPSSAPATPAASPSSAGPRNATSIAKGMHVTTATKVVEVNENNDPNDLIGRTNGYDSAAVIFDRNAKCPDLGVDCGATIEVWPSVEAAQRRSDYIQTILKGTPFLGTEYHSVKGEALLRVYGKLQPSVWKTYKSAFEAS